ncbi:MAG: PDZ domain-containing protein, partial [Lachnospiraceae bacterium]|nr:PDZ domain-containing protein [Lachnospiraceae bacterium]
MDIQELETGGKKYFWRGLVTGLLIAIMLICGAYIGQRIFETREPVRASANEEKSVVTDSSVEKMYLLQQTIEQYYLEEADPNVLAEGAYKGIIEALGDPYSSYYSVEELKAIQEQTEGIYYGIGAYIGMDKEVDMARISKVMIGSPAEESGVLAGDYIYMIGEEYAKGMELEELISKVKGPEGTKVKLTIIRETEVEPLEIEVTRRKIESPT